MEELFPCCLDLEVLLELLSLGALGTVEGPASLAGEVSTILRAPLLTAFELQASGLRSLPCEVPKTGTAGAVSLVTLMP